jgi:Bacterial PH domain
MVRPDLDERFRRSKLHRFLLADEHVIVAQRQHWASFWRPIVFGAGGLVVLVVLALWLPASLDGLNPFLLLAWFVVIGGWTVWRYLMWRRNWLVATDKRVMVNYGLLHQGVAMFSLSRVPDLTYTRSSIGQLLGYGELKRESAGINQTLHKVRFVEHPHATYTTICAAIFELQDRMFGMDEDEDYRPGDGGPAPRHPGPPPRTPGLVTTSAAASGPVDARAEPAQGEDPPGIRIHYGVSRHHDRDPWRQSADLRTSSLRDADTGPIPYRPSSTDESDDWLPKTTDKKQPDPQTQDDEQDP